MTTVISRPVRRRARSATSSAKGTERDRFRDLVVGPVGGQLDELGDEIGELVHFEPDALHRTLLLLGVERVGPVEQLGVRPQARERGPQLVAGVGHELLLLALRHGQRVDHRGEAGGEAADLAAAGLGDGRFEVLGAGDALRGVGQPLDRADETAREQPTQQPGRTDAHQAQGEQLQPERGEDVLGLLERARDLEDLTGRLGDGEEAVAGAVDRDGAEAGQVLVAGERLVLGGDRQVRAALDALDDLTVRA